MASPGEVETCEFRLLRFTTPMATFKSRRARLLGLDLRIFMLQWLSYMKNTINEGVPFFNLSLSCYR